MSLTNTPERIPNPADKYIIFKGKNFKYYDKEKKEDVIIPMPIKMAVLESSYRSFTGFNNDQYTGVYSNEVKGVDEVVSLRTKNGLLMEFTNAQRKTDEKVKSSIEGFGANYTQILYVAADFGNGLEIARIGLSNSPLTGGTEKIKGKNVEHNDGWFNFTKMRKNLFSWVEVNNTKTKKGPQSTYEVPVYSEGKAFTETEKEEILNLSRQVDSYFELLSTNKVTTTTPSPKYEVDPNSLTPASVRGNSGPKLDSPNEDFEDDGDLPF